MCWGKTSKWGPQVVLEPGFGYYVKKIVLKDSASHGLWKAKLTSILDVEDCWEIVNGTKLEVDEIAKVEDANNIDNRDNRAERKEANIDIELQEADEEGNPSCNNCT